MAGFVLPILSGLAGLFGGKSQQQQQTNQTTNQSQNQNYSGTQTNTPNLNPFQQQLAQMFTGAAMDQYKKSTNLAPYTSQGLQTIAGQGAANAKTIANNLASRGLSYSPAAATPLTQNLVNTGNQMSTFSAGVPLLERQLQDSALQNLFKAFTVQPYGTTSDTSGSSSGQSSSHTEGTGTVSTPGAGLAGLIGGLGAGLAAPSGGGSNLSDILKLFGIGGSKPSTGLMT